MNWDEYLHAPKPYKSYATACSGAFDEQRRNIARLVTAVRPRSVACLGAGVLNDIPYRELVSAGCAIHLVDWIGDGMDVGITQATIQYDESGRPQCLCCDESVPGSLYCQAYKDATGTVCSSYAFATDAGDAATAGCAAFIRGQEPKVHVHDVTGGYGESFAAGVPGAVQNLRSWKQAIERGQQVAQRARGTSPLDISDRSIDLVTSSLLVSQFEHEPYDYFARSAADVLGAPSETDERRLHGKLNRLRNTMLQRQVDGHCREICRILASDGVCYLSFEMFHHDPVSGRWFLVTEMHQMLDTINTYFDFDILPPSTSVSRFEHGRGRSIVQSFMLRPKPEHSPAVVPQSV